MIIYKIIKIINRQAQKVFAVAYMRSNCKALTGKILVFWIAGRLWVVVACEGGRHGRGSTVFNLQLTLIRPSLKRAVHRPIRLTRCCTQFKSPGVKILRVLFLHYNVAFTIKRYGNS